MIPHQDEDVSRLKDEVGFGTQRVLSVANRRDDERSRPAAKIEFREGLPHRRCPATAPISIQQTVSIPQEKAKPAAKSSERAPVGVRRAAPLPVASTAPFAVPPAPTYSSSAPLPPICRDCGVVQAVNEVSVEPKGSGGGAVAGGVVGGIIGNQIGKGATRDIATVLGAVGGAYAGNHIEKSTKESKRYDVTVRFEDGSTRTFSSDSPPAWHSGDRVRLQNGALIFDGGRSGANGFGAA